MRIVRHCRERLPGGEAKWRRLAKIAGFDGTLRVYGYGHGPRIVAAQQRQVARSDDYQLAVVGECDHDAKEIRVWMPAPCAVNIEFKNSPLFSFAHELGHFKFRVRGHPYHGKREEKTCDRIAHKLLKEIE